ncbi:MAG TPA: Rossmann-like and DUF2520 domain-containing protein [Candidatus Sulfotelmatobacter sp.]|nr:Rossmann-like and DUF2520 domain-containing protein [Candidatus Sulfotelmatobacter sp.]
MLPGMKSKRMVAIVGAGNLASALAISLHAVGYTIEAVVGRSRSASPARARNLAKVVGAHARTSLPRNLQASAIWFCVPDSEIHKAAGAVADKMDWSGRIALHPSGVLTSDELDELRRRGAAVASVHPMMTFVRGSRPRLIGVPFAVEGDAAAVQAAQRMVKDLGGRAYAIRKVDKAAYHAWGTFASPLFTALLATAEHVARAAGVPAKEARGRMIPILRQTLENYASFGAAAGFSGPIIRGDVDTVKRHLHVLRAMPRVCEVYRALALAAIDYLPGKKKTALRRLLKS